MFAENDSRRRSRILVCAATSLRLALAGRRPAAEPSDALPGAANRTPDQDGYKQNRYKNVPSTLNVRWPILQLGGNGGPAQSLDPGTTAAGEARASSILASFFVQAVAHNGPQPIEQVAAGRRLPGLCSTFVRANLRFSRAIGPEFCARIWLSDAFLPNGSKVAEILL